MPGESVPPSAIESGESGDEPPDLDQAPPAGEEYQSAALQRLGPEALARLRARYAEVLTRISERPMEEAARDELKLKAERLNPDAWVTAEDVTAGLEDYERVYDELRSVVGTRRRRRRR
jgi:hypothetical protein